jgi:hypothetical protein
LTSRLAVAMGSIAIAGMVGAAISGALVTAALTRFPGLNPG